MFINELIIEIWLLVYIYIFIIAYLLKRFDFIKKYSEIEPFYFALSLKKILIKPQGKEVVQSLDQRQVLSTVPQTTYFVKRPVIGANRTSGLASGEFVTSTIRGIIAASWVLSPVGTVWGPNFTSGCGSRRIWTSRTRTWSQIRRRIGRTQTIGARPPIIGRW